MNILFGTTVAFAGIWTVRLLVADVPAGASQLTMHANDGTTKIFQLGSDPTGGGKPNYLQMCSILPDLCVLDIQCMNIVN